MNLVTGSSGLVGSHLLYSLTGNGKETYALIRTDESKKKIRKVFSYYTAKPDLLLAKVKWVKGDVTKPETLIDTFRKIDSVYHCAALVSFNEKNKKDMHYTNVTGTANIVKLCLDNEVSKLVHVSSIAAIGKNAEKTYVTEEDWPRGKLSDYSFTKTKSEKEVWSGIKKGLNAVIVNPSIIIGPGHWYSGSGKLFSRTFGGVKFYTKGVTGFVDVRDVVEIMIKVMNSDISSERFIVSSANRSYKDILTKIAFELKVNPPGYYAPKILTSIIWRLEKVLSLLIGRQPVLTKQSANSAHKKQKYNSDKVRGMLNYKYRNIDDSIQEIAQVFLKDKLT